MSNIKKKKVALVKTTEKKTKQEENKEKIKESIDEHFPYLNEPIINPDKESSLQYIPCVSIASVRRTQSAPADIIHQLPVYKYKIPKPFQIEKPYPNPNIFLYQVFSADEIQQLNQIHETDNIKFVLDEKFHNEFPIRNEQKILVNLLTNVLIFCKHENFSNNVTQAILYIFYHTHKYFLSSLWHTVDNVYKYCKELILLHSVMDPPKSIRIFSPNQSKKILLFFCKLYLRHLPLIRVLSVPNYQINLQWQSELEKV